MCMDKRRKCTSQEDVSAGETPCVSLLGGCSGRLVVWPHCAPFLRACKKFFGANWCSLGRGRTWSGSPIWGLSGAIQIGGVR